MTEREMIESLQREFNQFKEVLQGQAAGEKNRFGEYLGDTKAKLDRMSDALNQLELKLQRPAGGNGDAATVKNPAKTAAFAKYIRHDVQAMTPEEVKLLTVSDNTTGGFGAPDEFDLSIIKGIVQISPVRSLARVRSTSQRSVKVMKRTGTFAAQWTSEVGTRSETTGLTYGLEEIPTHELYALVDISVQDLEDTAFDLEGELNTEFTEQFAYAEGSAFVNGNGVGKPEGLMFNAAVAESVTGAAADLTYNGFVEVSHNLKVGYLPSCQFILNLQTLGKARQLVSGTGELLWAPMAAGAPSTILGFPYTIVQDMANVGAGNYPVAFGDFKRAYQFVDRVNLQVMRDPFTQANRGAVRFIARKRVGGQVVLVEAFRKLKVSA